MEDLNLCEFCGRNDQKILRETEKLKAAIKVHAKDVEKIASLKYEVEKLQGKVQSLTKLALDGWDLVYRTAYLESDKTNALYNAHLIYELTGDKK